MVRASTTTSNIIHLYKLSTNYKLTVQQSSKISRNVVQCKDYKTTFGSRSLHPRFPRSAAQNYTKRAKDSAIKTIQSRPALKIVVAAPVGLLVVVPLEGVCTMLFPTEFVGTMTCGDRVGLTLVTCTPLFTVRFAVWFAVRVAVRLTVRLVADWDSRIETTKHTKRAI